MANYGLSLFGGKSGLINTLVKANGLVKIDLNTEGLDKEEIVEVILI